MGGRYLGIDMGGSGTRAHLLQEPAPAWEWHAAGGNVALDPEAALRVLVPIMSAADPDAACLGLAGARTAPEAAGWLRGELGGPASRITVLTDADLALAAAFGPAAEGIVICAGTGSVAVVRADGQTHLVGGHGYLLDDAGGAYDIGRRGLAAALRRRDGGEGEFAALLEDAVGESLDVFVAGLYRHPADRAPVAGLARILAGLDHPGAQRVLEDAADALLALADLARTRFGPLPVRYTGGVFGIAAIAARLERGCGATRVAVRPEVAAARLAEEAA